MKVSYLQDKGVLASRGGVLGLALLLLLCFAILPLPVFSLGISPVEKTVNFVPGETVEVEFSIINSEASDLEVRLSAAGEFSRIVFFEEDLVSAGASSYRTPFKAILKFPQELPPGIHNIFVKLTPVIEGDASAFSAYVSPQVPIKVRVPYPDKYVDVSLHVLDVDEGTPVPISLHFDNLGNLDISSAGGSVSIFGPDDVIVGKLVAPEISISYNSFAKTEVLPAIVLPRGSYTAAAKAYYDSVNVEFEEKFSIGSPVVEVRQLHSTEFVSGEVNELGFDARLFWNAPVKSNVFINIGGWEEEMPVAELMPDDDSSVYGFVDLTGVPEGDYEMTIRLVYGAEIRDFTFDVAVLPPGSFVGKPKAIVAVAVGLAIILVIAILIILIVSARKRHKRKGLIASPAVQDNVRKAEEGREDVGPNEQGLASLPYGDVHPLQPDAELKPQDRQKPIGNGAAVDEPEGRLSETFK